MRIEVKSAGCAAELVRQLGAGSYDFVSVHSTVCADPTPLQGVDQLPCLHGATSCMGVMTDTGVHQGLAAFAVEDPHGAYGTAMAPLGDNPRAAGRNATQYALQRADRIGEHPDMVWISATPGHEEAILAGIEEVVGPDVPIIGGSAAGNGVSDDWLVFDRSARTSAGVVVTVLFPSVPVAFAYQNGYSPTGRSGVVTRARGRTINEIDGRPALDVYGEWTGGMVGPERPAAGSRAILCETALWPLGRPVSEVGDVPFFLLAHPSVAHDDGSIDMFATIAEGERLTLMTGAVHELAGRPGRVAALARATGHARKQAVCGALVVCCSGCMLAVGDHLDQVVAGVNASLDGAPFLGAFTFGEQGAFLGSGNRHGNLMIACIIFG